MVGVFFGIGLVLGLLNAVLVQRSVDAITAEAHPLKRKMALNSATRLLVMTVIGLTVAFIFRPQGLGVVFGMALFQVLLVISTALPVMKKIRAGNPMSTADGLEGEARKRGPRRSSPKPRSRSVTTRRPIGSGSRSTRTRCWRPRSRR